MQPFQVCHVSDTHFSISTHGVENPQTGLNTRTEDVFNAFDQLCEFVVNNKIKYVLHTGDAFNSKSVPQSVVHAFYERLKVLSDAGVTVLILLGNHDVSRLQTRKSSLELLDVVELPNVHVTRGNTFHNFGDLQVATLNYWTPLEELPTVISTLAAKVDRNRPALLMGHLQVDYPGSIGSFKHDLEAVPLSLLVRNEFSGTLLGHIHTPKILNETPPVWYGGSLVRCSAAEEKETKGFWVFDVVGTKIENLHQIEVDCLRFVTFHGTISQLKTLMEGKTPDLRSAIVRLIIDETDEPIDEAFIKEKFGTAFKCIISKESKEKISTKLAASTGLSLQAYVNNYFEQDADRTELIALVEELRNLDEAKVQA